MKGAVYNQYGPPEIVEFNDTEKPAPKNNEELVCARA